MSIKQQTVIDRIEVIENGIIHVRQATITLNGEVEISRQFKRWVLLPGIDISNQTAEVKEVCNQTWTNEVVEAYLSLL